MSAESEHFLEIVKAKKKKKGDEDKAAKLCHSSFSIMGKPTEHGKGVKDEEKIGQAWKRKLI